MECQCGCGEEAPIAKITISRKGIKKGDYLQFVHGHHNRTKTHTEYAVFEREDALSFYLLGVWMSDGWIEQHTNGYWYVGLASIDKDWIADIAAVIFPKNTVGKQKVENGRKDLWRIRRADNRLAEWLQKWGCVKAKTHIAEFPNIPEQYYPDFIRGMIDGDGSIISGLRDNRVYKNIYVGTASRQMAGGLMRILSEKFHPCFYERITEDRTIHNASVKGGKSFYQVQLNRKVEVDEFLRWLYYDGFPRPCLERKYEKAMKVIEI